MLRWVRNALFKESAVGKIISRMVVGRPTFPTRDFATFAKEAYKLNIIAFRCIELISTSAASVQWLLYKDDKEIDQKDHPLLLLLRRPNPMQSGKEYFTGVYAYDLLTGNSYQERVRVGAAASGAKNAAIQELWALRPDRVRIVPGPGGMVARFRYEMGGEKHEFEVDQVTGACDCLHVKRFNPLDDWYGQSPLEAIGMSVDSHNEATRWNYAVLKNGARPSGALEYGGETGAELDDQNYQRLKQEIEENYSGSRRGRPMLLQGGLKWVQMMLTQMEMDWARGKEVSAAEIAIGYGVPEQLVGVKGQQTYNNYREARMALHEDAVLPLLDRYSEALTNWFNQIPAFEGLRIDYDEDTIPALAPKREALWEKLQSANFLTIDEKRAALGYEPYDPQDGEPGAVIFVSAAEIPLLPSTMTAGLEGTGEGDPAEEGFDEPRDGEPQLGTDGKPLPVTGGPVQDLALNGAQIQAVVQIVQNVVDDLMPAESAIALLRVAFPSIDEATARALVEPASTFEKPKPDPVPPMPGQPGSQPPGRPGPGQPGAQPGRAPGQPGDDVRKHVRTVLAGLAAKRRWAMIQKAHRLAYGRKG